MAQRPGGKRPSPITDSRIALSQNLRAALAYNRDKIRKPETNAELADSAGIALRTLQDMISMARDPQLANIDRVASILGVPAWSLLYKSRDAEVLYILEVYARASPEGRRMINTACRIAEGGI